MKTKIQWVAVALCASAMWLGGAAESYADKKPQKKSLDMKGLNKKDLDKKLNKDLDQRLEKELGKDLDRKIEKLDDWKFDEKGKSDVRNYYKKYADKEGGLPPGLAKKVKSGKPLPQGWKDKVKPGWKIDDEWWERLNPLSAADLPASFKLSDDVGAYLLGNRIIRVDKKTRKMLDYVDVPSIKL